MDPQVDSGVSHGNVGAGRTQGLRPGVSLMEKPGDLRPLPT